MYHGWYSEKQKQNRHQFYNFNTRKYERTVKSNIYLGYKIINTHEQTFELVPNGGLGWLFIWL